MYRAVSRHLFHPNPDFQIAMEEHEVFLYHYGDPIDGITANHLVVVINAPNDKKAKDQLCSLLSFVPIENIWICGYYLSPKDRYFLDRSWWKLADCR